MIKFDINEYVLGFMFKRQGMYKLTRIYSRLLQMLVVYSIDPFGTF